MSNKYRWVKNLLGASKPLIMPGLVQAGSSVVIEMGELCNFNETSGYFAAVSAVGDEAYSLAIANEEQKAADSARYMEFIMPREGDVFEFALSSADTPELGEGIEIYDPETVTLDPDGNAFAVSVGHDNYPQEGTTIGSKSYAEVVFLPQFSYFYKNVMQKNIKKVLAKTSAYTLHLQDCGCIITNKGATGSVTITGPNATVPIGYNFKMAVMADQVLVFDPKPDTASVYIKGDAQTAGKYISMTDIGDFAEFVWDGTDWLCIAGLSGADADISVET